MNTAVTIIPRLLIYYTLALFIKGEMKQFWIHVDFRSWPLLQALYLL